MQINDQDRKEIEVIHREVAELALRLRNIILQYDEDEDGQGSLSDATSLIHAGELKLDGFLRPQYAVEVDWTRRQK